MKEGNEVSRIAEKLFKMSIGNEDDSAEVSVLCVSMVLSSKVFVMFQECSGFSSWWNQCNYQSEQ